MFLRLWPPDKYECCRTTIQTKLTFCRLIYIPIEASHINAVTSKIQHSRSQSSEKTVTMTLSPKSLAGPGYIILNGIRAANIIGLLAVVTASIVMLVRTTLESQFFFFDAASHVLTAITGSKPKPCPMSHDLPLIVDSVPLGLRVVSLPPVLRAQLAAAQSVARLRHARCGDDRTWHQHARQPEQVTNESEVSQTPVLADRDRLGHRHLHPRPCQHRCSESHSVLDSSWEAC